jgi:putative membrane protein
MKTKTVITLLLLLSGAIFSFLIWFIYFKETAASSMSFVEHLPLVNSLLNTCAAICMGLGVSAIIKKQEEKHIKLMFSALGFSALFLVSYLFYHHFHGDVPFLAQGLVRPVYFFILISHILLTFFVLPMILITVFFALTKKNESHKKIAKWTFPIWMYVSVTGVLIYILQVLFNR